MNVISVRPASQPAGHGRNFHIVIFLDTVNVLKVKVCMIVELSELSSFVPLSVILATLKIQGYKEVYSLVTLKCTLEFVLVMFHSHANNTLQIQA